MYDVIIAGGSFAGISAALTLARSLRAVLVFDDGDPCNRNAQAAYNFIGHDGSDVNKLRRDAQQQLLRYPSVKWNNATVQYVRRHDEGFIAYTNKGECYYARKILLATGLSDTLPHIEGMKECWGRSVLHCPYCHGYEHRNKPTGVLTGTQDIIRMVSLLRTWTRDLTVFTNGEHLPSSYLEQLRVSGTAIVTAQLQQLQHNDGYLTHIYFQNGDSRELGVLYTSAVVSAKSDVARQLGCLTNANGRLHVDADWCTSVPGIFAAGDLAAASRSVATAAASGQQAATAINELLACEDFSRFTNRTP